jgi:hypothetical protein
MNRVLKHTSHAAWALVALTGGAAQAVVGAAPAMAQVTYEFDVVADSRRDGLDPFSFGCASINAGGDVAFRAGRLADDGFNTVPGIYRAGAADGSLTTIVEDDKRFSTIGFNPSMNDLGQVSFAARVDGRNKEDTEAILVGDGRKKLTTVATTADEFNFFGFDTSINNAGVVAFKAELDEELGFVEGLFSGSGREVTTHYLNSTGVRLDGQRVRFTGSDSRPAINDAGVIAFEESVRPGFDSGIFAGSTRTFTTLAAPSPDVSVGVPSFNDAGTAAFERSFVDGVSGEFVTEIVTSDATTTTTVASSAGPFSFFGFRPPALNELGDVAFVATLDDNTTGIFTGGDPVEDRVIAVGDSLMGTTVTSLNLCEEGLNEAGQLAFVAFFEDPATFETRAVVFRASPAS